MSNTKNMKVNELKVGMKIGKTIIDNQTGNVLIQKGCPLTNRGIKDIKEYFAKAKKIDIKTIKDERQIFKIGDKPKYLPSKSSQYIQSAISKETQQEALNVVNNVMRDVRVGKNINSAEIKKAIGGILDDMMKSEDAIVNLLDIKDYDDYTYTHCINVATISLMIGRKLDITKEQLFQLGEGALLHDLGKIKIPEKVLNKPGKLTEDEFGIMKKHPLYTYEILKDKGDISEISKYIAMQHHEKFDGSGYPFGLAGEKINYFARIVALADVYDALTTARSYKKAMSPYKAMQIIISGSGKHFDSKLLKGMLNTLSIYPPGSYVELNTGEKAIIKKINDKNIMGPVVEILKIENNKVVGQYEMNLADKKNVFIKGATAFVE